MISLTKKKINSSKLFILWGYLKKRRRKQFWLLLVLMFIASLLEVVSIGAVLPFIGMLTAPEHVFQHQLMQPLLQILGITEVNQLVLPLTVIFITAALLAGIVRFLLLYVMTRLTYATGSDLSIDIYQKTLYQEYAVHTSRNSSEVINGIISKTGTVIGGIISPILTMISSAIVMIGIISALIAINISVAVFSAVSFSFFYYVVILYTRKQLKFNSKVIADQSTQMVKSLQEGLGGIRDVLIDGSQKFYCNLYRNADLPLRNASASNVVIAGSPRYIMESIGMSVIAVIAYFMSQQNSMGATTVPILGALALGAQRLLPALQQFYGAYSTIKGSKASFQDVLVFLEQPLPQYLQSELPVSPIKFKNQIQLSDLSFYYKSSSPPVLHNINLTLKKGDRIGFMGETGSGKSTLLDIIMGLLSPSSGKLSIDGQLITSENKRAWQAHIAHVPQNIYLSDSTVEENIAFGTPLEEINHQQVKKAAKLAQISELIEGWEDGYNTFVGECGVRLSGGQRQRIGIARALYKQADVLIFDEATSALDNKTEKAVMTSIGELDKELTILIIAHRLTTLKGCNKVVKMEKNIIYTGSYQEIVNA